ncbi:PAS domain-containing protein [Desertibaculum subflavum]|uniref:PAS domain-containing protein n=1 Tax=Desertibaculum subflavum TaxID=2268458 RepID=UPI000E6643B6
MQIDSSGFGESARRLLDYWLERRGGRHWPARKDIAPADFAFALGKVSLVECAGSPPRFRYRVVSTGLTEQLGYEMTGRFTEDIPEPDVRSYVERLYAAAMAHGEPYHETGTLVLDGREWAYETLVLPLSTDDVRIEMLLIYREAVARHPRTSVQQPVLSRT